MHKRFLLLFLLFFTVNTVSSQTLSQMLRVQISGTTLLGERMEAADVNGDGFRDVFASSSSTGWAGITNAGVIVLLQGPFREWHINPRSWRDTTLELNRVAQIAGSYPGAFLGREFRPGHFNGDPHVDIAVTMAASEGRTASIGIFFGPFTPGDVRLVPDVRIENDGIGDGFGVSLAVLPNYSGTRRDGLAVGANFRGRDEQGQVLLFTNLTSNEPVRAVSSAATVFDGPESTSAFGSSMAAVGDLNGDGIQDLGITAPNTFATSGGFKRGSVLLFFGPFAQGLVSASTAGASFNGRHDGSSWGSRIFAVPDLNRDGLREVGFSSTIEGAVALAYGRRTWARTGVIGLPTGRSDSLILFRPMNSSQVQLGIAAEFAGDYNRDGIPEVVIGSNGSVDNVTVGGGIGMYNLSGVGRNMVLLTTSTRAGSQIALLGNASNNDPYAVDDIVASSPRELQQQGYLYFFRGEINPPIVTFSVSPTNLLELGQRATLNLEVTKGSRDIRRVRVARSVNGVTDSLRFELNSSLRFSFQESYSRDVTVVLRAEAIDDFNILVSSGQTLLFAARPRAFEHTTQFAAPVQIGGSRTQTLPFTWQASADTNRRRTVMYDLYIAATAAALDLSAPESGRIWAARTGNLTGQIPFGTLREQLNRQGIRTGQTGTVFFNVFANNGVLLQPASNGPSSFQIIAGSLENNLVLNTGGRGVRLFGLLEDGDTFSWSALQSDQTDQIVRYEFVILDGPTNTARVLFSDFSQNNGFALNYRVTYGDLYDMLRSNNLLQQAVNDSARVFYTVRALINESNFWWANAGPRRLGIKMVRIFNDAETEKANIPDALALRPNYPNPFNPETQLPFGLPVASPVRLEVFSITGQRVYRWESGGALPAGWHTHRIGLQGFASGMYVVRVASRNASITQKIMLLK